MTDLFLVEDLSQPRLLLKAEASQEANQGFSELKVAHFQCEAPGDWTLYIDDAPMPKRRLGGNTCWDWAPGFYSGSVVADLVDDSAGSKTRFLLDVSPDPAKLGQDTFRRMVEEIRQFDLGLILGTEPANLSIGQAGRAEDPSVRLARMLRHEKAFLAAMRLISEEPLRAQRGSRMLTRAANVRRIDAQTVRSAASQGLWNGAEGTGEIQGSTSHREPFYDVPISEMTFDTPANRALLAILNALLSSADRLMTSFDQQIEKEVDEDTRTALKDRWPRRRQAINHFMDSLRRFRRKEPLRSVTRAEFSASGLTSLTAHPRYARARQIAWNILRPGFLGTSGKESTWMSPTWHVYEAWCMVRIARALQQGIPELDWTRGPESTLRGVSGSSSVTLRYQPTFSYSESGQSGSGFQSISAEFRPDVVLLIETPASSRWMVLDAKYSHSRTRVLRAMRSAHLYHDALRWQGKHPDGSMLLVPSEGAETTWLHGIAYQEAHGVGVIALSPDQRAEDRLVVMARSELQI
jgi:hypothetical protein